MFVWYLSSTHHHIATEQYLGCLVTHNHTNHAHHTARVPLTVWPGPASVPPQPLCGGVEHRWARGTRQSVGPLLHGGDDSNGDSDNDGHVCNMRGKCDMKCDGIAQRKVCMEKGGMSTIIHTKRCFGRMSKQQKEMGHDNHAPKRVPNNGGGVRMHGWCVTGGDTHPCITLIVEDAAPCVAGGTCVP